MASGLSPRLNSTSVQPIALACRTVSSTSSKDKVLAPSSPGALRNVQ